MEAPTLLTLPYDIRVEILKNLLCGHSVYTNPDALSDNSRWDYSAHDVIHVNILFTCKDLYQDGVDVLYRLNIFEFLLSHDFFEVFPSVEWFDSIGDNIAMITTMVLPYRITAVPGGDSVHESEGLIDVLDEEKWRVGLANEQLGPFAMLASDATGLRHLRLYILDEYCYNDVTSTIISFGTLSALAEFKSLQTLELEGGVVQLVAIHFLSAWMGIPVQAKSVHTAPWYFESSIGKVLKDGEGLFRLAEVDCPSLWKKGTAEVANYEIRADLPAEEESRCVHHDSLTVDTKQARISDTLAFDSLPDEDEFERLFATFDEKFDLHTSGKYWPPINFHKRALEIELGRLDYLLRFWDVLKATGIVVPRVVPPN